MTTLADRLLPLTGTVNARDVGGHPTPTGLVARGRLLRSDALHRLDDADRAHLQTLGLRTVIDLRHDRERNERPDALDGMDVVTHHLPIRGGDLADPGDVTSLAEVYDAIVRSAGPSLAAAVAALAGPDALPAMVHCTAGKDRTGIVVALVLELLGVEDGVLAADYAASEDLLRDGFQIPAGGVPEGIELSPELVAELLASPQHLILDVLDQLRGTHGSVEKYLLAQGLDPAVPDRLRTALVES